MGHSSPQTCSPFFVTDDQFHAAMALDPPRATRYFFKLDRRYHIRSGQAWVFPLGILGIVVSVLMLVPASLVTVVCSAGCSSRLLRGGPHKCRGVELFEESLLAIYYLTRYCVASRIVPLVSLIS